MTKLPAGEAPLGGTLVLGVVLIAATRTLGIDSDGGDRMTTLVAHVFSAAALPTVCQ